MEDNTLFVDPGVEIQFYPNVGILVLGKLTMMGWWREVDAEVYRSSSRSRIIIRGKVLSCGELYAS